MTQPVEVWPNGLGWDVGEGTEVWKLKDGLGVHILTSESRIKYLLIPDATLGTCK